ncbi:MAG: hypothetical protein ACLUS6_15980 [Dysosmobacter sp.]
MGGILGLLFATVGVDNFTGTYRFTFGSSFLKERSGYDPHLDRRVCFRTGAQDH